jgi:hypothetical protein
MTSTASPRNLRNPSHRNAAYAATVAPEGSETAGRFVGFCALCEQDYKLTAEGTFVHHGYRRPGDGEIHGDCELVHTVPYEVGCEALAPIAARHAREAARLAALIEAHETGKVTYVEGTEEIECDDGDYNNRYGRRAKRVTTSYSMFVTQPWVFRREIDSRVWHLKTEHTYRTRETARLEAWIAGWSTRKHTAPRTFQELLDRASAEKAARAAAREAARAEKAAKREANENKRVARAVEHEARVAEAVKTVDALFARHEAGADRAVLVPELVTLGRFVRKHKIGPTELTAIEQRQGVRAEDSKIVKIGFVGVDRFWFVERY